MGERPVSDAEYLRLYDLEVRRYVAQFDPRRGREGPGAAYLGSGRWAWVDDGRRAAERWHRYASGYGSLLAMNADGTWRPLDPRSLR